MKEIKKHIAKSIEKALKEKKIKIDSADISFPPKPELGDYAYPCFKLAGVLKKDPKKIAKELEGEILSDKIISKVKSLDGFVNFYLRPSFFYSEIINSILEPDAAAKKRKEKIMIEYSSPNPGKTFHIGHLRNTILGKVLVNLYEYEGYKIIKANYLNDTGIHIAKVLWLYQKKYQCKEPKTGKGKWLGGLYVESNFLLEKNKEFKKEIDEIHQRLEAKDKELTSLLVKFKKWSQKEFDRIYFQLGVDFDQYFYDSDYIGRGKEIVAELLKKGIAKKSEGAAVVDLEKYNLHTALILKSDGSAVYITKDFAMAKDRFKKYKVDKLVYVVGSEQILHFKQLFKILELYGFKQAKNCVHLPYELVRLTSGKISSRAGGAPLYSDLYDAAFKLTKNETKKRHKDWGEKRIDSVASAIALASIKFDMLRYDTNKVIVFDVEKSVSLTGDTGPYILYTVARINSILKKVKINPKETDFTLLNSNEEKELISSLSKFELKVRESFQNHKPSVMANYILELTHNFNHFYHTHSVMKAENVKLLNSRGLLALACGKTLKKGLELLNITYLDEM